MLFGPRNQIAFLDQVVNLNTDLIFCMIPPEAYVKTLRLYMESVTKYITTTVTPNIAKLNNGSYEAKSVAPIRIGITIPEVNGMYENTLINKVSGFPKPEIIT